MIRDIRGRARSELGAAAVRAADALLNRRHLGIAHAPSHIEPRWGYATRSITPLERQIRSTETAIAECVARLAGYHVDLARIPRVPATPTDPCWLNDYLPALDTISIYGFLREREPARYLEIGSGFSTKVAARAKLDGQLGTQITSIDPNPRTEIDSLCDQVIRCELQDTDQSIFDELEAGDVVLLDGSHVTLMNSDVVVFMLEILPRLPAGVLIGVHDIYLPDDYPPEITDRYYTEQYILAAYLVGLGDRARVVLPAAFVSRNGPRDPALEELYRHPNLAGVDQHGCGFWFEALQESGRAQSVATH